MFKFYVFDNTGVTENVIIALALLINRKAF